MQIQMRVSVGVGDAIADAVAANGGAGNPAGTQATEQAIAQTLAAGGTYTFYDASQNAMVTIWPGGMTTSQPISAPAPQTAASTPQPVQTGYSGAGSAQPSTPSGNTAVASPPSYGVAVHADPLPPATGTSSDGIVYTASQLASIGIQPSQAYLYTSTQINSALGISPQSASSSSGLSGTTLLLLAAGAAAIFFLSR